MRVLVSLGKNDAERLSYHRREISDDLGYVLTGNYQSIQTEEKRDTYSDDFMFERLWLHISVFKGVVIPERYTIIRYDEGVKFERIGEVFEY